MLLQIKLHELDHFQNKVSTVNSIIKQILSFIYCKGKVKTSCSLSFLTVLDYPFLLHFVIRVILKMYLFCIAVQNKIIKIENEGDIFLTLV